MQVLNYKTRIAMWASASYLSPGLLGSGFCFMLGHLGSQGQASLLLIVPHCHGATYSLGLGKGRHISTVCVMA